MAFLRIYLGKALKEQYELKTDTTRIGRAKDNDIVLGSPGVSKHHAVVERQAHKFVLRDNDSANGIMVNGRRVVKEHVLNFRDEIQIMENTLVFMALAKLPGEAEGMTGGHTTLASQEATMAIDGAAISDLLHQRKGQNKVAQLAFSNDQGQEVRQVLEKANFTIGRARTCDARAGGWFAPAVAATLQKRENGIFLVPDKRGQVELNTKPVQEAVKLQDEDRFSVRGARFTFYFRPVK